MPVTQIYLVRHGEPDYEPIDSRGWPGMAADSAPLTAVGMKQAEFEAYDGEWPEGIQRRWEPLSRVRERARGALARHAASTDGPVLAITHATVIRALTGEQGTAHGAHEYYRYDPTDES
jgi:broad specificity phosphatase PhoE